MNAGSAIAYLALEKFIPFFGRTKELLNQKTRVLLLSGEDAGLARLAWLKSSANPSLNNFFCRSCSQKITKKIDMKKQSKNGLIS